ncbi:uncharacterized protein [Nicotiana tomentosiformis]|uniref:uncharacterized protein n=1 Tax=Nicotiana tomentosiformis TaxID=4098 RepID=UPI00388C8C83
MAIPIPKNYSPTQSLWSSFLKAKYCQRSNPISKKWDTGQSQAWKRLTFNKKEAEKNIQRRLQSRNCSFWWDNWLGSGPLAAHRNEGGRPGNVSVSYFWNNGQWNLQRLNESAPAHMIALIIQTPIFFNNNLANFLEIKWPHNWQELYPFIENLQHQTISTQVVWNKLIHGFVKINSDGSALTNQRNIGAGVIIRDHNCAFIHAITAHLGEGTNNFVETEAALLGIQWCLNNGFTKVHLESDSALLIQWLTNGKNYPWSLKMKLQQLSNLCIQCESFKCSHTYREANCPADSLSKLSHELTTLTNYTSSSSLPNNIRG